MLVNLWASLTTFLSVALAVLHFAHPWPLYQIPDRGHRILPVPEQHRVAVVGALVVGGLKPYGTFTAGLKQTLMWDGFTVVASGKGVQSCAISLPVDNPAAAAKRAQGVLLRHGIKTTAFEPPDLKGKLTVVQLPFGLDIAYRLPGSRMGGVEWQRRWWE